MEKSFYRRFGLAILPVVVICMPFIVMGAYTGARSNRNVVADWLPAHFEETRRLEWFNDRFGTAELDRPRSRARPRTEPCSWRQWPKRRSTSST